MTPRAFLIGMPVLLIILAAYFVLAGSGFDTDFIIPRRISKLSAMIIAAISLAVSSIVFQTITGNRILTPAIMGYEAVYLFWQSLLVLLAGTASLTLLGNNGNFAASVTILLAYSAFLQRWLFRRGNNNVWLLLLAGFVLSMVISTFSQFVQLKTSPGEFAIFQSFAQLSFDNPDSQRLAWATGLLVLVLLIGWRSLTLLDVMSLGRDQSVSLGLDHAKEVRFLMALIAVLVAISTSLVGPSAFVGIFVANTAYALYPARKHKITLLLGGGIALGLFLIAQIMVEQVFNYKTTVGILVNLVCGIWFLALMLKQRSFT
jgi:iron complex transport system permease protein